MIAPSSVVGRAGTGITLLVWPGSVHFQISAFRINYITTCTCELRTALSENELKEYFYETIIRGEQEFINSLERFCSLFKKYVVEFF